MTIASVTQILQRPLNSALNSPRNNTRNNTRNESLRIFCRGSLES